MAESVERLLIRIDATTEQLRRELKRAEGAVDGTDRKVAMAMAKVKASFMAADKTVGRLTTSLQGIGAAIIAGGFAAASKTVIDKTIEQEKAVTQLEAVLRSTGGTVGRTSEELQAYARNLQQTTAYGDEAVIAAQSMMLTFTQIQGVQFDQSIEAVLNLSTAMKQDLKSSVVQLGKALNDPIANLSALSRTGIQFSEDQKELIKGLAAAGDMAGAQTVILKELETQFGGSAEAARDTLGGALDSLGNTFGDLLEASKPAIDETTEGIKQLEETLADPAVEKAIQNITDSLATGFGNAAIKLAEFLEFSAKFGTFLGEEVASWISGPAMDDLPRLTDAIAELEEEIATIEGTNSRSNAGKKRLPELRAELDKLRKLYDLQIDLQRDAVKVADEEAEAVGNVVAGKEELNEIVVTATRLKERELTQAEKVLEQLRFEAEQLDRTSREQFIYNQIKKAGVEENSLAADQIREVAGALWDEEEALKASEEATKEHIKNAVDPWQEALTGAAERIDEAFADAWKGSFDSFGDFASSMKDALKNLLAEMAHMAITKPIIVSITGAMGLGGTGGALASPGGGGFTTGELASGAKTAWSGLTGGFGTTMMNGYAAVGDAAYSMFGANSMIGNNAMAQAGIYGQGGLTSVGYGLLNAGAGFAGNYVGQTVFGGNTTGIGSAAGGMVGSIWGPLGTAVGSFLGEGLEVLAGNLLGFGGKSNNRVYADITDGQVGGTYVKDSGRHKEQREAIEVVSPVLQMLSDAIGGTTWDGTISASAKHGLEVNGKAYGEDFDAFFNDIADDMIQGSENMAHRARTLARAFDGSAEELIAYTASIAQFDEVIRSNSVSQAKEAWQEMQNAPNETAYSVLRTQTEEVSKLIDAYDGSLDATVELNAAMQQNKVMAYEMAMAIQQISESIGTMLAEQADYFRESVMTEEELFRARLAERDALFAQLQAATDPEEVLQLTTDIANLNKMLFDSMTEEQQLYFAEGFAAYTEELDRIAQEILGMSLDELERSQGDLNRQASEMMNSAATAIVDASKGLQDAAADFGRWTQFLVENGITVNVTQLGEVNR